MISRGLPGFRDFPPEDFALRAHIFRVWREVAGRNGFEEYDGPPLEPLELYTAKSGDEIVGQLYNFVDKGDRQVALRPEMTPTLARMVGARANGMKKPIRWFSIPQLFRYERQQRGRLREHFQLNCDLIGEAGPLADAEIIALSIDMMRGFGLGPQDVRVRLSDRRFMSRMLDELGIVLDEVPGVFTAIDRIEKNPEQARAMLVEQLQPARAERVVEVASTGYRATLRAKVTDDSALGQTMKALEEMGLGDWIDFDPTIVRGLAYYTGTVFELFDAKRTLRAICGGGRYDTLLDSLGGADLPALGFGMGDVVLGELLKDRGLHPAVPASIDCFVAAVTQDDVPHVLETVARTPRRRRTRRVRHERPRARQATQPRQHAGRAFRRGDRPRRSRQELKSSSRISQARRRRRWLSRLSSLVSRLSFPRLLMG